MSDDCFKISTNKSNGSCFFLDVQRGEGCFTVSVDGINEYEEEDFINDTVTPEELFGEEGIEIIDPVLITQEGNGNYDLYVICKVKRVEDTFFTPAAIKIKYSRFEGFIVSQPFQFTNSYINETGPFPREVVSTGGVTDIHIHGDSGSGHTYKLDILTFNFRSNTDPTRPYQYTFGTVDGSYLSGSRTSSAIPRDQIVSTLEFPENMRSASLTQDQRYYALTEEMKEVGFCSWKMQDVPANIDKYCKTGNPDDMGTNVNSDLYEYLHYWSVGGWEISLEGVIGYLPSYCAISPTTGNNSNPVLAKYGNNIITRSTYLRNAKQGLAFYEDVDDRLAYTTSYGWYAEPLDIMEMGSAPYYNYYRDSTCVCDGKYLYDAFHHKVIEINTMETKEFDPRFWLGSNGKFFTFDLASVSGHGYKKVSNFHIKHFIDI